MGFVVKVSDLLEKPHKICWFSGCDLHLPEAPGLRKPLAILQGQKNLQKFMIFEKKNISVDVTYTNGKIWHVPLNATGNRHWDELQEWVAAGNSITAAD